VKELPSTPVAAFDKRSIVLERTKRRGSVDDSQHELAGAFVELSSFSSVNSGC
jgi:UDP-N-acetylglucosamine transferase subunit ALG13